MHGKARGVAVSHILVVMGWATLAVPAYSQALPCINSRGAEPYAHQIMLLVPQQASASPETLALSWLSHFDPRTLSVGIGNSIPPGRKVRLREIRSDFQKGGIQVQAPPPKVIQFGSVSGSYRPDQISIDNVGWLHFPDCFVPVRRDGYELEVAFKGTVTLSKNAVRIDGTLTGFEAKWDATPSNRGVVDLKR
jgi:hypothetical protein